MYYCYNSPLAAAMEVAVEVVAVVAGMLATGMATGVAVTGWVAVDWKVACLR